MAKRVTQAQAGTRREPITPKLESMLQQIGDTLGVTFVVVSGGQDAKTGYVGSTRHDVDPGNHGGAADVRALGPDGKAIDFATPSGQKTWGQIAQMARKLGATGIGAAEGYMGSQEMHIGFQGVPKRAADGKRGSTYEGVWGAGGKAAAAPQWLREAWDAGSKGLPLEDVPEPAAPTPMPGRPKALSGVGADDVGQGPDWNQLMPTAAQAAPTPMLGRPAGLQGTPAAHITVNGGAPQPGGGPLVRLPSGQMVAPGVYPGAGDHSFRVSVGPDGEAKIEKILHPGEIPGLLDPMSEAKADTVAGTVVRHFAEAIGPQTADAAAAKLEGVKESASGAVNALTENVSGFGSGLQSVGQTMGNAFGSLGSIFSHPGSSGAVPAVEPPAGGLKLPSIPVQEGQMSAKGAIPEWGWNELGAHVPGPVGLADVGHSDSGFAPSVRRVNPDWVKWNELGAQVLPSAGQGYDSAGNIVSRSALDAIRGVGPNAYQAPIVHAAAPVVRGPAPPQFITVHGGAVPAESPIAQLVRIASGKTVPVGTQGTAQGGAYAYEVQPNGTVLNKTTGRVMGAPAAAPRAPAITAGEAANDARDSLLGSHSGTFN